MIDCKCIGCSGFKYDKKRDIHHCTVRNIDLEPEWKIDKKIKKR